MTKKETIEKLTELGYKPFDIEKDTIHVYDKNIRYITTLNLTNGRLTWNGNDVTKIAIPDLMELVNEYNKTLEFNPCTYDPHLNAGAATEMRVDGTLEDCGFEATGHLNCDNQMQYKCEGPLGAKYSNVSGNLMFIGGESFIELYKDDASDSEKCNAIKSMVNVFYVAQIAELCNRLDKMGDIREKLTSIPIQTFDYNTMNVTTTEGVDGIIALLEKTLKRLKK